MTQRKDQRTEKASPSFATKIYSNLQAKPKAPADGWAKQRKDWVKSTIIASEAQQVLWAGK